VEEVLNRGSGRRASNDLNFKIHQVVFTLSKGFFQPLNASFGSPSKA